MPPLDYPVPWETFLPLQIVPGVKHAFLQRAPGLDVRTDREEALRRLAGYHEATRERIGFRGMAVATAEQIHGCTVAHVRAAAQNPAAGADALITNVRNLCLAIYVADCCAIYFVDPVRRAIGLAHSGRKGTELNIAGAVIAAMRDEYGSEPGDLIVQLSPCIRPPHYEIDFAAQIVEQCRAAGVEQVQDCGICTGANLARYYSYRVEKGRTGRLLALLALS